MKKEFNDGEGKKFSKTELIDETRAIVAGVFESEMYLEMLEELTDRVVNNLEFNLDWEDVPEDQVYDVVEKHMRRIWSVI